MSSAVQYRALHQCLDLLLEGNLITRSLPIDQFEALVKRGRGSRKQALVVSGPAAQNPHSPRNFHGGCECQLTYFHRVS